MDGSSSVSVRSRALQPIAIAAATAPSMRNRVALLSRTVGPRPLAAARPLQTTRASRTTAATWNVPAAASNASLARAAPRATTSEGKATPLPDVRVSRTMPLTRMTDGPLSQVAPARTRLWSGGQIGCQIQVVAPDLPRTMANGTDPKPLKRLGFMNLGEPPQTGSPHLPRLGSRVRIPSPAPVKTLQIQSVMGRYQDTPPGTFVPLGAR